MSTADLVGAMVHSNALQTKLARIAAATWQDYGFGAHALVAADDHEVLVLLTARFHAQEPGNDLYVVDATDRCYRGLDNAKAASVRDLKVEIGLQ
jgi:hypothetical protein